MASGMWSGNPDQRRCRGRDATYLSWRYHFLGSGHSGKMIVCLMLKRFKLWLVSLAILALPWVFRVARKMSIALLEIASQPFCYAFLKERVR